MTLLILVNVTLSILLLNSFYPLLFGLILLIQTTFMSLTLRNMTNSSWISFTVFIITIGGLMIIFMYTTSICANQKFKPLKIKWILFYWTLSTPLILNYPLVFQKMSTLNLVNLNSKEFFKLFLPMNTYSTLFTLIFLLWTLLIMINLLNFKTGPLRKKY